MDVISLGHPGVAAAALLILAVALASKFVGAYVGARAVRVDHWNAVALGAGLNARGVMEIILAAVREAIYRRSHPLATRDLRIVRSELAGSAELIGAAERNGYTVSDVGVTEPTLETVFINLTGRELRE